jgi:hypothetical protein
MALIEQLARHYEWALGMNASQTDNGPFSRFCSDVFECLELDPKYNWEHLLRAGPKLHRTSFITRLRHKQPSDITRNDDLAPGPRPRKRLLVPKSRKVK